MRNQQLFVLPKYDESFKELMKNEVVRRQFIADFLEKPFEQVVSAKLLNTFLWKARRNRKQGILDVLVELEDGTKVDIEIQLNVLKYWDKRALFYLAKLYTEDLRRGENYSRAKRCIVISLLDFNLNDDRNYHRIYRLRDENGNDFTDMLEIQIVELRKKLDDNRTIDDWIRLLNARSEEELKMVGASTKNKGIKEAVRELNLMNLPKNLRLLHEDRLKYRRDMNAMLEYAKDQGMEMGIRAMILDGLEENCPKEKLIAKLEKRFELNHEQAKEYFEKFSK